jgi:hypothetical protein
MFRRPQEAIGASHALNQNLPELALIEGNQQVANNPRRITFSFFVHLSFATFQHPSRLVLRFYDGEPSE